MHGRQDKKKKMVKGRIKKKPEKKKAESEERQIDGNKPKPEESSVSSPPQPEPSPAASSPANRSSAEPCQGDQSKAPFSPAKQPPDEIVISDDSSMEVEIKIVEETTPIHRQLTSFVRCYFQLILYTMKFKVALNLLKASPMVEWLWFVIPNLLPLISVLDCEVFHIKKRYRAE
jgi:hypothetical protein